MSNHFIRPIVARQLLRMQSTSEDSFTTSEISLDERMDFYLFRINVDKNKSIHPKNVFKTIVSWFDHKSRSSGPYELDINHYNRISYLLFGNYDGRIVNFEKTRQILSFISFFCLMFEIFRLNATFLLEPYIVNFRWYITEPLLTYHMRLQNLVNSAYSVLLTAQMIISFRYLRFNYTVDQLSWWRMLMVSSLKQLQTRYWLSERRAFKYFKYCKMGESLICICALFFWLGKHFL